MFFLINVCLIVTYHELFSQPDESKRAKNMLKLAILRLFRLR
jgi:hypothetical protein